MIPLVKKAACAAGSIRKLAKYLGIHRGALYEWKAIPAQHVIRIEELTGGEISRHEMRPDVFGKKPKPPKTAHAAGNGDSQGLRN